jgi:2-polyprenyl-3-methyl-5-hydroxy-6-metoxy-1,4-benzoquinol methylase
MNANAVVGKTMSTVLFERLATLSEPLRVRLLRVLAREELAVGELARVLQTSQPTVSRHLKQLDAGGWVQRRPVGTAAWYRLSDGLDEDARQLWDVVAAQTDLEAYEPGSLLTEDLRRLAAVLASRTGDSEELFRRLGGRWDGVRRELFGESYLAPLLAALLSPGLCIADLGCGTGGMLPLLATGAQRVYGVDREAAMLEVAAERVALLPQVELRRGLLGALPLDDHSVDLCLCALVLHHVADPAPVFAQVRRVLRPDGRFVLLDMVAHDREDYRSTMGHQHLGFGRVEIEALALGAGLVLRSWAALPPDPLAQGPGLFVAGLAAG